MDDTDLRVLLASMIEKQDLITERWRELDGKIDALLITALPGLRIEIAMLQVRSGIWGAVAGMIPVVIILLVQFLSSH